jgi:hypothetical protein
LVFNLIIFANKMQLRIKISCPCTEMIIFLTLKYIIFLCFIEYAISVVRPNLNIVPVIKQMRLNYLIGHYKYFIFKIYLLQQNPNIEVKGITTLGFSLSHQVLLPTNWLYTIIHFLILTKGRRGRDRMVVRFTTTYAISAHHHWCCEF